MVDKKHIEKPVEGSVKVLVESLEHDLALADKLGLPLAAALINDALIVCQRSIDDKGTDKIGN
ncbi:MAG: hypothetical protein H6918_06060 [Sphingomonadaceae bacterium]|nr:hypothetical protein [Sphingomonadaceae bacterium]